MTKNKKLFIKQIQDKLEMVNKTTIKLKNEIFLEIIDNVKCSYKDGELGTIFAVLSTLKEQGDLKDFLTVLTSKLKLNDELEVGNRVFAYTSNESFVHRKKLTMIKLPKENSLATLVILGFIYQDEKSDITFSETFSWTGERPIFQLREEDFSHLEFLLGNPDTSEGN